MSASWAFCSGNKYLTLGVPWPIRWKEFLKDILSRVSNNSVGFYVRNGKISHLLR